MKKSDRERKDLPFEVEEIENRWIPMRDGTRSAARIWMPKDAPQEPVPAVLEYIPYRKRDLTRARDALMHPYFAGHGYAALRVDLRGSGDSEGILEDEYLEQELQDGEDVLAWIAQQDWCDGSVGIIGKSWGGFNGLQLAYRQPPELKAIITVCSTDDRYATDVHYMGGCLLGDNLSWASEMFAFNSCPPDPRIVGEERWKELWLERLEKSGLWIKNWLEHQHRDGFWKHGSVCEDISRIEIPVFAVSGWADGYTNAVFRLMNSLKGPKKGLVGPWSHKYPHEGVPGPAIGFLQECVRWWDRWMKGKDTGVDDEPTLMAYLQDSIEPSPGYHHRPGRWVALNEWPSKRVEEQAQPLAEGELAPVGVEPEEKALHIRSPLNVGLFAGKWCSYSATPDMPHDQRQEDGGSLVFDSRPLEEDLDILGAPVVELELKSDKPVAMVAVRLSDVRPDDKVTRVTYGLLNLTHRDSHEHPEPLEPGKRYRVRLQLNHIAQRFPKGHRYRLSLSTSYWPLAWPPPSPVRLTVFTGSSRFTLPVLSDRVEASEWSFEGAESAPSIRTKTIRAPEMNWWVHHNMAQDRSSQNVVKDSGIQRIEEVGLDLEDSTEEWYSFLDDDFNSATGEVRAIRGFEWKERTARSVTRTILSSTETHFHIDAELDAYEDGRRIFSKNWNLKIPRDLV